MKTNVDGFGRIVIPKSIRDDLGLQTGDALEIKPISGGILLRPERETGYLSVREGVVVYEAEPSGDVDRAVEEMRKNRLKSLGSG